MFDLMLRRVYNISIDAYEAMVEMQHGVCAVCGKLPRGKGPSGKRLHVDHNHLTEALRGLLCAQCNMALGLLQENKTNIRALLTYLEAYEPDYS